MKKAVGVLLKVLEGAGVFFGIVCILSALLSKGDDVGRVISLIVGVWVLSMGVLDQRLKSMDQSLTMIAVSKLVMEQIDEAYKKVEEIKKHGTTTGNSAKAAKEEGFDTTAKTGAHE